MKQNNFTEKLHTALLSLSSTLIMFCAGLLWNMNGKMIKNDVVDSAQDVAIIGNASAITLQQKEGEEQSIRLTKLEAILPERIRLKIIK